MSEIAIFGLGYVGAVAAVCLARDGHSVVGVDISPEKVRSIAEGRAPLVEAGLDEILGQAIDSGRLRTTTSPSDALASASMALVCVGTPSAPNGEIDLVHVRSVIEQISSEIASTTRPFTIVVRSTVIPGTTEGVIIPIVEAVTGELVGDRVQVCFHPEFLREGSSVEDYDDPPKFVVGSNSDVARKEVLSLYPSLLAPVIECDPTTAELVKYVDNTWHALKVAFANEIGRVSKAVGVDGRQVMDIFVQDTKLNISPKYLRPGTPFGGSCLPKDVRALRFLARRLDLELPIIESVLPSNERHLAAAVRAILATGRKKVGLVGLSFKDGTDDLRESPLVEIAERLIGKGCDLAIYDPEVRLAALTGTNRLFIEERIPHVSRLLRDNFQDVVDHAELLVIGRAGAMDATVSVDGKDRIDLTAATAASDGMDWRGIVY